MRGAAMLTVVAALSAAMWAQKPGPKPAAASAEKSAAVAVADDSILKAMRAELQRASMLKLASFTPPYYIEYAVDDVDGFVVEATLGGLIRSRRSRARAPRIQVRVGDYESDNTNYLLTDFYRGPRYDLDQMPLDDDVQVLREYLWLSTDRAYKAALEASAGKRAALQNISVNEKLPDFSKAAPVKMLWPVRRHNINEALWRGAVTRLSSAFTEFPQVTSSSLEFEAVQAASYMLNSEGAEIRLPDHLSYVRVRAEGMAPDGAKVRDAAVLQTISLDRMPAEADIKRAVQEAGQNVTALARAPLGESYNGPVLFEGTAAAQLFAELIGGNAAATRRPVVPPGRQVPTRTSEFEGRTGARVMPEWIDVVDDPTQREYKGRQLSGYYPVDLEGVVPKPVTMIEKGAFKNFLLTRQPVRGGEESNGRARLPGSFGAKAARISNLFVKASEVTPAAELKKKLLATVQQRGKPYGMIVRKMDFPSSASADELRALGAASAQAGSTRPVSLPLLVYRVYPDGREELVRGLRFRGVTTRTLKDITAASDQTYVFDFLDNGAPFALMGAGGFVTACTVVAPSIIIDDLELERPRDDMPRPPIVPPPSLSAAAAR